VAPALAALIALVSGCSTVTVPGPSAPRETPPPPKVETFPAPAPAVRPAPPAAPRAPTTVARPPAPAPEVVPRIERIASGHPNQPYTARGESYDPHDADVPMREVGLASWYGRPFQGRRTSNGERYDMHRLTAAHKTMPLPSYARVRNLDNGREIVVRVNDRGPFVYQGRVIDLSYAAARKLGFSGLARVEIERITHDDIRTGAWRQPLALRGFTRGRSAGRAEQQALADTAPTTVR
jgi:rare lipoprotein A